MRYYNTGKRFLTIQRGARSVSYLLFALSGWVSLFTVSPIIDDATTHIIGVIWAFFLGIGGTSAFFSILMDNWFFEYFGLPALIAAFSVISLAAFSSFDTGGAVYLSSAFITLGIGVHLMYRFWELHHSIHHSKDA